MNLSVSLNFERDGQPFNDSYPGTFAAEISPEDFRVLISCVVFPIPDHAFFEQADF